MGVAESWKTSTDKKTALPVEHPLHAWQALMKADSEKKDVGARWKELATAYSNLTRDRTAARHTPTDW